MLSPVRKKNLALLNLSSQCIVFTEKCIFVPHEKKTIDCCLQENKIFWLRKVQKKKVTSTMKIPATPPYFPIRKWLLPNKIIVIGLGTKLHLVEVMPLLAHPLFISLICVLFQIQWQLLFVCLLKLDCKKAL